MLYEQAPSEDSGREQHRALEVEKNQWKERAGKLEAINLRLRDIVSKSGDTPALAQMSLAGEGPMDYKQIWCSSRPYSAVGRGAPQTPHTVPSGLQSGSRAGSEAGDSAPGTPPPTHEQGVYNGFSGGARPFSARPQSGFSSVSSLKGEGGTQFQRRRPQSAALQHELLQMPSAAPRRIASARDNFSRRRTTAR